MFKQNIDLLTILNVFFCFCLTYLIEYFVAQRNVNVYFIFRKKNEKKIRKNIAKSIQSHHHKSGDQCFHRIRNQ